MIPSPSPMKIEWSFHSKAFALQVYGKIIRKGKMDGKCSRKRYFNVLRRGDWFCNGWPLECVLANTPNTSRFSCIDSIASFILDPPPARKVLISPRPKYRVFCLFFIFFSSRHKSHFRATVITRFAVTRLIRTPHGHFALSLEKENSFIFSKFYPLNRQTPR